MKTKTLNSEGWTGIEAKQDISSEKAFIHTLDQQCQLTLLVF